MDEALATSLAAVATALLVALWTVGGRSALQRRTIKQELDIAAALPVGPERQRLEQSALERATLYAYRRDFRRLSPTGLRWLRTLTITGPLLFVCLIPVLGSSSTWYLFVQLTMEAILVLMGGLLGYWVSYAIRLRRARTREFDLAEARAALQSQE